jgi:hypothetical protein
MNEYEKNILANIEEFGCSVTSVVDPAGKKATFSYSIGIARSCGAPELIVVGLGADMGHWLVNEFCRRARGGESFDTEHAYSDFLEGYDVRFVQVAEIHRREYMRSACWLHDGADFLALQMVYPDRAGNWPWESEATAGFRVQQPILF